MNFVLEDGDVQLMRNVLDRALSSLREEIGKTENYEMRQDLKRDEDRLKAMISRLASPATTG